MVYMIWCDIKTPTTIERKTPGQWCGNSIERLLAGPPTQVELSA